MIRALVVAFAIIFIGNELSERVRIKQEESILHRLPEQEALAYYELLKRRIRKTRVLRGLVLVSLVILLFSAKKIFMSAPVATP